MMGTNHQLSELVFIATFTHNNIDGNNKSRICRVYPLNLKINDVISIAKKCHDSSFKMIINF